MSYNVGPMKEVARMIQKNFVGIITWTGTRQNNSYIKSLNGLF